MIDIDKLADQFAAAGLEDWRKLVDSALGERSFDEALRSRTLDDITVEPLYYERGEAAFVPGMPGGRWEVRQMPLHPDPAVANREILEDLEGGAAAVHLKLHPASWDGGRDGEGVLICGRGDFERMLRDVRPEAAAISLEPGPAYLNITEFLTGFWGGVKQARGNWGIDPLGALAQHGSLEVSLSGELRRLGELGALAAERWPGFSAACVDTRVYHDAGASEAQELAATLATGAAYLRALEQAGLSIDQAARQIEFRFAADMDVLMTIAKLRSFRRLWAGLLSACGETSPPRARLHVFTSRRMLSRLDPWVNIMRTTIAGLTAGIAGADAVTILPFSAVLGIPDAGARRLARNIQLLLIEESNLHRVADPLKGAFGPESISDQLAAAAWALFQEIERREGIGAVLSSGWWREKIARKAEARRARLRCRDQVLTGVSSFPILDEEPVPLAVSDSKIFDRAQKANLKTSGEILIDGFDDPAAAGESGETLEPFRPWRLSEPFEVLRQKAAALADRLGRRPRVFLVKLGRPSDHIGPATEARNLFAAAGIEANDSDPLTKIDAIADAVDVLAGEAAAICGARQDLAFLGPHAISALREAGVTNIYLAGDPQILEEKDRERLTGALYRGTDIAAGLEALIDNLGGP